jgi:hypothetical protein
MQAFVASVLARQALMTETQSNPGAIANIVGQQVFHFGAGGQQLLPLLQHLYPDGQHLPLLQHTSYPEGQRLPHPPQLRGSLPMFTQMPPQQVSGNSLDPH